MHGYYKEKFDADQCWGLNKNFVGYYLSLILLTRDTLNQNFSEQLEIDCRQSYHFWEFLPETPLLITPGFVKLYGNVAGQR